MTGASFDGTLDADSLQVGEMLLMRSEGENKASFKEVNLRGAKITGQIDMTGASFGGVLYADSLQVGEMLLMRSEGENKASFKDVDLPGAKITGQIDMTGASFDGTLDASYVQVGDDLILIDAHCARPVVMVFAHIGGNLNLAGATLAGLYLSGASIAGDLTLNGAPYKSVVWKGEKGKPGTLNLRNTHIGNLMDANDAWPAPGKFHLDGFSFKSPRGIYGRNRTQNERAGNELVGQLGKA